MRIATILRTALAALALAAGLAPAAHAAEGAPAPPAMDWSFDGPFGTYDRASAQRGYQVYKDVCAGCHSMDLLFFRDLRGIGFTEDEVKALAAGYQMTAGPNDQGEMFERPGLPSDHFPAPFPNEQAARAINGGAYPPDLSLIAKARAGGADYIRALLVGYEEPPEGVELMPGMSYNLYFPGHQIAMPQFVMDDAVAYTDGTPATAQQIAWDVSTFLMWAAEPHLEERKAMGVRVLLFLVIFTGLFYMVKRKVWSAAH